MRAIYARFKSQKTPYERQQSLDFAPLNEKLARASGRRCSCCWAR